MIVTRRDAVLGAHKKVFLTVAGVTAGVTAGVKATLGSTDRKSVILILQKYNF